MKTRSVNIQADLSELIGQLAEDYAQRLQRGEQPDIDDYARRHPDAADALRQILPALEIMGAAPAQSGPGEPAVEPHEPPEALGDFRIIREIGRGGMGVVYEATQRSLSRRVALKVLPFAAVLDPKHLQRFKNESQAAASLKHPSIVGVYSVGCERGVHYYAMEYVEGQSLAEVIDHLRHPTKDDASDEPAVAAPSAETEPQALAAISTERSTSSNTFFRSVAQLGIQAAEALAHAHEMGIVHRDIKPSNLMVDAESHLSITDFGLAMVETDANLTMTGDLIGTLRYMSPEQATGGRTLLDHRTDIYSLGITLYELLTLKPAFAGDDRQALLHDIALDEPRSPRRLNPAIPADLETIILKAIRKDPAERYTTAGELADDLGRFLHDEPIRARPLSVSKRMVKWSRRHRTLVSPAVAVASVVIVLAWAFFAQVSAPRVALRHVWSEDTNDNDYAVSPNGRYSAYINWDNGNLGVTDLEAGTRRELTTGGTWDDPNRWAEAPIWSPDSRQLVYVWWLDERPPELRLVSIDGGPPRTLYTAPAGGFVYTADWSPDGRRILVFLRHPDQQPTMALISVADGLAVHVRDLPIGTRALTLGTISPDGRFATFTQKTATDGSRDVFVHELATGDATAVVQHPADDYFPLWSPDGKWLTFLSNRIGDVAVWMIPIEAGKRTGAARQMSPQLEFTNPMGISRRGEYFFWRPAPRDIFVVDYDPQTGRATGSPRRLIKHFQGHNSSPVWSPDGTKLAYLSARPTPRGGRRHVPVVRDESTGQETINHADLRIDDVGLRRLGHLAWMPDGKSLLIRATSASGERGIFRWDIDARTTTPVVTWDRTVRDYQVSSSFAVSADATALFYGMVRQRTIRIIRRRMADGEERQVATLPASTLQTEPVSSMALSPSGNSLAVAGPTVIALVDLDSGQYRSIYDGGNARMYPGRRRGNRVAWTRDGRHLIYTTVTDEEESSSASSMWRIAREGRKAEPVGVSGWRIVELDVHPSGERIAFTAGHGANVSEIWAVENSLLMQDE